MSDDCAATSDATSSCGCAATAAGSTAESAERRRLAPLVLPVISGLFLLCDIAIDAFFSNEVASQVCFWAALIAGGLTFIPGSLRKLFTRSASLQGRLGIGLLMTISAIGAVLLGHVAEAASLAFLFSIAEGLEQVAFTRARRGLRSLLTLLPDTATVKRGLLTQEIPTSQIKEGDVIVVKVGDAVPTDGNVSRGTSALDTSAITGESIPSTVVEGDAVYAGSINTSAPIEVTATNPGTDNSITTIVELVEQATAAKGERARLADRIAKPLVPGVLLLALAVGLVGSLLGDPATWINRALVVLVAASPCAIAIAVPVTVISAIGAATRWGVVIKSGAAFERMGTVRKIALDKTGTLTANSPTVVDVVGAPETLAYAASIEKHSSHPLARAIVSAHQGELLEVSNIIETPGQGMSARIADSDVTIQSPRFSKAVRGEWTRKIAALEAAGKTVVVVTRDYAVLGIIAITDPARESAAPAVAGLKDLGMEVAMLTGDNRAVAASLGEQVGIQDVHAQLLPQDKAAFVDQGGWAMVGDGINDAPALAAADIGIAMGATGTDAAVAAAEVAFTGTDLRMLPVAFAHARRARRIMNINIALALAIIVVLPPLAITGVLGLAGVVLVHEVAEVLIIAHGLWARGWSTQRTGRTGR